MASPFRIPKKIQEAGGGSAPFHLQSPLSRLHSSAPPLKSFGGRVHAGNAAASRRSAPCNPPLRNVITTLLGLNTPSGAPSANHRAAGSHSGQSQAGQRAEAAPASISSGWRPKRASDRLLQPPSPPQKKRGVSVESADSLAALRGEGHAGSLSSSCRRAETEGKGDGGRSLDSFTAGERDRQRWREFRDRKSSLTDRKSSLTDRKSSLTDRKSSITDRKSSITDRKSSLTDRKSSLTDRKSSLTDRKPERTPMEPIVLSSEEEEEEEGGGGGASQSSRRKEESQSGVSEQPQVCSSRGQMEPPPSFLQLPFISFHSGLTHADANGELLITESGITIPLKGSEEGEVTVVASHLRGYGMWDVRGPAPSGLTGPAPSGLTGPAPSGLTGPAPSGLTGPAPSLLFLWVSQAQAGLLQVELPTIQSSAAPTGPPCCFLLLVLRGRLPELQAALLLSLLDTQEYRRGCSSSVSSPLQWADGLMLLHSCPPPVDRHLLSLLGHSTEEAVEVSGVQRRSGLQQPSSRLIQYPAAPVKGRITVTTEDLSCLNAGEHLNDVIIDFYLKFLLLEGVSRSPVAERCHIFSSFFYKQLSRRRAAGEDGGTSIPDRHMRHQRVKTWTRHVDIFTKDFLFVPVNQEAHWFLVVVCFPGLEEVQYEEFQGPKGRRPSFGLRCEQPPECTLHGWQKETVMKRPCILVMDSLKLSDHENVCRQLRDYLQVEWEVRRGGRRVFCGVRSFSCSVPQQDNSSDCGLYLLQYTHTFLQNPVVHFAPPLRLDRWFPRQRVRQKRAEIRRLIMEMHRRQAAAPK